jgi:PAS domain-containing protein
MAATERRADSFGLGALAGAGGPGLARAPESARPAREAGGFAWHLPASAFPMWIFDHQSGSIVAANDAAARAYGYTREELLVCTADELCPTPLPGKGLPATARSQTSPWTGRARHIRKDRAVFDADIATIEIGQAPHAATMVLVMQMQAALPPESRSKTLLGRAETMARLPGAHPSERDRGLRGAFVAIDAREVVERARERVRVHSDAKNVDVVAHCTCGPVRVQPEAFSDALYELLHNAVRAARRGHPVIVDVRDVEGDVLWQVQDAGEGMVEGSLAKLGKLPETAGPGSARLGIARAWAVVEAHGGLLRFESAPGVGTTATIWLPRVRERWEDTPAEGL